VVRAGAVSGAVAARAVSVLLRMGSALVIVTDSGQPIELRWAYAWDLTWMTVILSLTLRKAFARKAQPMDDRRESDPPISAESAYAARGEAQRSHRTVFRLPWLSALPAAVCVACAQDGGAAHGLCQAARQPRQLAALDCERPAQRKPRDRAVSVSVS
jgi:hypothetical protein